MTKSDSVEAWLEQLGSAAADRDYRPGHARMQRLLQEMSLRRPGLRIRVAGTNGKGSTAFMLAAAMHAADLSVGLYTSPHILRFNERIRINGVPADDATLTARLRDIMPAALACGASYFEAATALALACFSDAGVDVEILEAGVGARLDATTAVPADMALITPIALDHQAWLGDSLPDIAREKAAAMDGCADAISAPQDAEVADVLAAHRPDVVFATVPDDLPALRAAGEHQRINAALALAAVRHLRKRGQVSITDDAATAAVAQADIPGRLQHVSAGGRNIWLDAAHNLHAIEALLPSLPVLAEPFDAIFVFPRTDRDLGPALSMLRPYTRRLIGPPRYRGGCDATYACVEDALAAEITARDSGHFLALGSFVTVAAAWRWLSEHGAKAE